MEAKQPSGLNAHHDSKPDDVPVFGCVVYVSLVDGVGVRARVANLAGLESTAGSERDALRKIVAAFKQCVAEHLRGGTPIPWIDPPVAAESHEQQRLIPVHL
ncbi:MAG TPA: hypothetical protein VGG64_25185 [Pirellulales bacterium]